MSQPQHDTILDPITPHDPRKQAVVPESTTYIPRMAVEPMPPHLRGTSPDLRLCLVRGGWMLSDVEHLCGIPTGRLGALGCGAVPTAAEIHTLRALVPSWRPVARVG